MESFRALLVDKTAEGHFARETVERQLDDLPEGDLLIDVRYSSLNYKDALSATGNPGVTRKFPHTPGIDAAGVVLSSNNSEFSVGQEVLVTGYDLGMNTPGGFGQRIRIPSDWAIPLPSGMSLKQSMLLGTAGLTAALCVDKLQRMDLTPADGPVLVTGATGGVGSVAVMLLVKLGYSVTAVTGKRHQEGFLRQLGASEVLSREVLTESNPRPLGAETWAGAVDTVGGVPLSNILKTLSYGGSVAACGLVSSPSFEATVLPFILRNINLLGVDSVELPREVKNAMWQKLAGEWKLEGLDALLQPLSFDTLSDAIDRILAGEMVGRGVLDLAA